MSEYKLLGKFALCAAMALSAPTVFADGFEDGRYIVTQGDFDGDGDIDLYVHERRQAVMLSPYSSILLPNLPMVAPFALLQGPNKTFVLDTELASLNLSNTQPSSVQVNELDVNLDGIIDAVLSGIGPVISGAKNQIVYSNSVPGDRNSPVLLRAIDGQFHSFMEEVSGWFERNDYFEFTALQNNWYTITTGQPFPAYWRADYIQFWGFTFTDGVVIVAPGEDPFNPAVPPSGCARATCIFDQGVWALYLNAPQKTINYDYSHFNADARSFTQKMSEAFRSRTFVSGSTSIVQAANILQGILGTYVFQNGLANPQVVLGFEQTLPTDWIGDYRLSGLEHIISALALFGAAGQSVSAPNPFVKLVAPGLEKMRTKPIKALEHGSIGTVHGIVLHRTTAATLNFETAKTEGKGTHFWVDKNGDIYQTASLDKLTWHVGPILSKCINEPTTCTAQERAAALARVDSNDAMKLHDFEKLKSYPKRYPINKDSIGIEVVSYWDPVTQTFEAATQAQLDSIHTLVEALKSKYGLTNADIYHHDEVNILKKPGEGAGLGYP